MSDELGQVRDRVQRVSEQVREAVDGAVAALNASDQERLYRVILNDLPINREIRAIDTLCHTIIEQGLPTKESLRFVSSVLRLSIALERVGDYAVTIARVGVGLTQTPPPRFVEELTGLAVNACHMLQDAMDAFIHRDVVLAQATAQRAKTIDRRHDEFFRDIMASEELDRPLSEVVSLLTIIAKLERVSDQAKNVCEEAVFVVTGQTKAPKKYKILFVDEKNDLMSQVAMAIAQKLFPESGQYSCAGWAPDERPHPRLQEISEACSLNIEQPVLSKVAPFRLSPAEYHVIVSINGGANPPLSKIPFHTVHLKWALDARLANGELVRQLSERVQDLVTTLRGDDAP